MSLIIWLLAWLGLVLYSFHNPGFGAAVALVLGQFDFPSRDIALFPGAPLVVLAAVVGSLGSETVVPRRSLVPALAALLLSGIGAVSLILLTGSGGSGPRRTFLLFVYVAPLAALVVNLDKEQLVQFKTWLLRLAAALAAISMAAYMLGGVGRAATLGGGPIPLAQLMGFGVIIVAKFPEIRLVPAISQRVDRYAKLAAAAVFLFVAVLTGSRFPVIALALSFPISVLLMLAAGQVAYGRLFRRAVFLGAIIAGSAYALPSLIRGSASTKRFELLIGGFGDELSRSRGVLFREALERSIDALPFGYGPGNLGSIDLPGVGTVVLSYPHNVFLESLGDFGLAGLLTVLIVVAVTFFHKNHLYARSGLLTCALFSWLVAQTSGDMVHNRYLFVFSALYIAAETAVTGRVDSQVASENDVLGLVQQR